MREGLPIVGALALGLAAGCNEEETPRLEIDPVACMDTWADLNYPISEGALNATPASAAELPPELMGARNDAHQLVGFQVGFIATEGTFAVSAADVNTMVEGGALVALTFEGGDPQETDYDTVELAHLNAPSDSASLPGQVDAACDLSRGAQEWSFEEVYGTEAQRFGLVFLTGTCAQAVPAVDGTITTRVEITPEGEGYRVGYVN